MARIGAFDRLLEPLAWWEAELLPAGWYVDELLVEPVAGGVTGTVTATLGSATLSATGTGPTTSSAILIPSSNNPSYRSGFYSPRRGGTPKYPSLWDGCVGAWAPSLGQTGGRLFDHSVYQNHGTLTNMDPASDWVVSGGKGALDFDGTDDYVEAALPVPPISTPITISCWVSPVILPYGDGSGNKVIVSLGGASQSMAIYTSHTTPFYNGSFTTGPNFEVVTMLTKPQIGSWYHLCMMAGAGTIFGYVDGVLQGTAFTATNTLANGTLWIGKGLTSSQYSTSLVDDIRIYHRHLTPNEIKLLATRRGIAFESKRRLAVRSGEATPSGTLAKTLDSATLTSSGTSSAGLTGTLTSTLDAATLASTGTVGSGVTATVSVTLAAATLSSSGTVAAGASGTVTRTLDNATLSSSGTVAAGASGSVTRTLENATLSSTGGAAGSVTGSVASTLAAVTCSSSATLTAGLSGTVTRTLAAVTSSATGTLAAGASGSVTRTLADSTLVSTGSFSAGLTAQVNRALDSCVVSSSGTVANGATGSLSVQLASATLVSGNVALGGFRFNVAGEWKDAMAFVKVTGTWKSATPFVKVSGVWK